MIAPSGAAPPATGAGAWNGSAPWTLHQAVQAHAARTPGAPALVWDGRAVSYAELDARANRLAHHLRALGAGPELRVAVSLERGPEAVTAILAVLKAGAAYVPLDPAYPAERRAWMLADSAAALLVTRSDAAADLPAGPWGVLELGAAREEIARRPAVPPDAAVDPDGLAYVIYTSGSTGTPKGVMVSHRGLGALAAGQRGALGTDAGSRVLQFASLSFDASVWEMAMAFFAGAALVLARRDELLPGDGFTALLREREVTHLTVSPSFLTPLPPAELPRLRVVVVAGEACAAGLVERWAPGRRFFNAYGPTEGTVCAAMGPCAPGGPVTLGKAFAAARVHVLAPGMRPAAPGETGELYLGGPGLARGYHGRPAATAERFVPDPFGAEPGARLYRTGDLVRPLADGRLEFVGRADQQVKVRGHRVEPGEVEHVLRACPAVSAAAVGAYTAPDGLQALCAWIVPARGDVADAELRDWLGARLPAWMVPGVFVRLAEIPLTPNGKADRARLPLPSVEDAGGRPPATRTERVLAAIWREVLGLPAVSTDAPFLALGGHSLRAVQVLSRISSAFGVNVAPALLLGGGSIREVASVLDAAAPAPPAPALERVPRGGPLPLSLAQEATWFFEQLAPGALAYRAQATVRMRGPLDVPVLERALAEIVRRHEIFRTTFPVENGGPVQRVHAPWPVRLPVRDVAADAVPAELRAEFLRPFDTSALPLVRWTLLRPGPDEHVLVIVEHHFVHDGWSFGVFLRELRALYEAGVEGRGAELPEPAVQFADFSVWQRRWVESPVGQAGLRFWEAALAGVPALELPTDAPRPPVLRFRGAAERLRLPAALAAEARALSRARGVTLFVTLLAAFQALLARYSGQRDFAVGSGLANRGQLALEDVIGMVVNTVAIRADLDGDPTGAELLRRVRGTTLRAYEHQAVPFDQVVRRLQPERTANALPVYQVAFSFHDAPMPRLAMGPVRLEVEEALSNGSAKFDLQVVAIPRAEQGVAGEEVTLVWEYSTDLFQPDTVRRMAEHYQALLEGLVREPGRPVWSLELMGSGERARVLAEWNRTAVARPSFSVSGAVAAWARHAPDAPAVARGDEVLRYGELHRRACVLAARLRRLGVGPESRVGVCLERGPELAVALLATLRAGAAYVAMDPAYPPERLDWMLADSGAAVLLTTGALRRTLPPRDGVHDVEMDAHPAPWIGTDEEDADPPCFDAGERGAAYVIYTSGSTGTPKGVVVEHRGLANLCAWHADAFGVTAADRGTLTASPGFDASAWELWPYLVRGACLDVVPDEVRTHPEGLRDWLVRRGVTVAFVPTPVAEPLLGLEWPRAAALRWLLAGGDRLRSRPDPALPFGLSNNYGPTECTVVAASGPVEPEGVRAPSIGRPVENARVYVLDARMSPVPAGVPGELFIGGAGVARGYLRRPALTAERFVPDPFSGEPGARMYRTGDRVRWAADGTLEYLGRLDEQVKVRGFRIEPGEIEAALRRHPSVRDCAVAAREDRPGEVRLAAYVVAAGAEGIHPAELRAHLRAGLPEYMVPPVFVPLDALPLTPHGKLDRRALPAPAAEAEAREGEASPATETEGGIALIWREILGVERVARHDDFFALGGDSLLATRVVVRTRDLLRRQVPLTALFDHRTLAAFSGAAEASLPAAEEDDDLLAGVGEGDPWAAAPGEGWG